MMKFVAGLGYDGIELAPFTLAPSVNDIAPAQRQAIRDAAARTNLEVCGLHWLLAKTEGYHLNHPEEQVRSRTSQYLCNLVDCCADLGGKVLVLGSPKQRDVLPGISYQQARDLPTSTITAAVKRAEDREVTLCLEPLAAAETNFINSAAEAIQFVQQINSTSLKIVLDVKAMCAESKSIPEIILQSSPYFAHFHANDRNLKGPGFGDVDFHPIARALNQVGYDAYVSVEVFRYDEGPEAIAQESLSYLRKVFSAADERSAD